MILILMSISLGVIIRADDHLNAKTYDIPLHREKNSNNINFIEKSTLKNHSLLLQDNSKPWSSHPDNQTLLVGQINATIVWYLYDDTAPGEYIVYQNETTIVDVTFWVNATPIYIPINTSITTTWIYSILFYDAAGNSNINFVWINVVTEFTNQNTSQNFFPNIQFPDFQEFQQMFNELVSNILAFFFTIFFLFFVILMVLLIGGIITIRWLLIWLNNQNKDKSSVSSSFNRSQSISSEQIDEVPNVNYHPQTEVPVQLEETLEQLLEKQISIEDLFKEKSESIEAILRFYMDIPEDLMYLKESDIWFSIFPPQLQEIYFVPAVQLPFFEKNMKQLAKIKPLVNQIVQIYENVLKNHQISTQSSLKSYLDFLSTIQEKDILHKSQLGSILKTAYYQHPDLFQNLTLEQERVCNQFLLDKKGIVVDGNNVARYNKKKGRDKMGRSIVINEPQLLLVLYETLKRFFAPENIYIYVSAAFRHNIGWNDKINIELTKELIDRKIIEETPGGEPDDIFCLMKAYELDYFILSNDMYRNWKKRAEYTHLSPLIDQWRVTFMFDAKREEFTLPRLVHFVNRIGKPRKISHIKDKQRILSHVILNARIGTTLRFDTRKPNAPIGYVLLYDETGTIKLMLWEQHQEFLDLEKDQGITIEGAATQKFQGEIQLRLQPDSIITPFKKIEIPKQDHKFDG